MPTTHQRAVPGAGRGNGMRVLVLGCRQWSVAARRMRGWTASILGYARDRCTEGSPVSDRLRLMCVHAHPDDESSKGAATMARYVDEGHEVLVVSCTGGERGDVLNPRLKDDVHILRDLAQVRRDEMAAAQAILGVQHTWLGFVDSGLPEGDPLPPLPEGCFALEPLEVTTEALVREIRRFRPHVVTTYDENGGYPHPDHVMCHDVSMAAVVAAGDPDGLPARRAGLAAAEGLLQPDLQPGAHRGVPRGAHGAGRGEPVRRVARELDAAPTAP